MSKKTDLVKSVTGNKQVLGLHYHYLQQTAITALLS